MYTIILNPRYKKLLKAISLTVLTVFIFTINACVTYSTEDMTPQQFVKLDEPEKENLLKLTTKDSVITAEEYSIGYEKIQAIFYAEKIDSVLKVITNPVTNKNSKTIRKVSLNDVLKITREKSVVDCGKTLLLTGITIGVLFVMTILAWGTYNQ